MICHHLGKEMRQSTVQDLYLLAAKTPLQSRSEKSRQALSFAYPFKQIQPKQNWDFSSAAILSISCFCENLMSYLLAHLPCLLQHTLTSRSPGLARALPLPRSAEGSWCTSPCLVRMFSRTSTEGMLLPLSSSGWFCTELDSQMASFISQDTLPSGIL